MGWGGGRCWTGVRRAEHAWPLSDLEQSTSLCASTSSSVKWERGRTPYAPRWHSDGQGPCGEPGKVVCSQVMKIMAEGHLALLTDLPLNSYSPNPNRSQRAREPMDVVHTDQRVRVRVAQGKRLSSSAPACCQGSDLRSLLPITRPGPQLL